MKIFTLQNKHRIHKKLYGLLITIVLSLAGFSQNVGINSTGLPPNASAGLDIDFPNMGLLIPRVALTGTLNSAPLTAHVAGMEVYNTATVSDVLPGFYYNNGTKWITGFITGNAFGNMLYWNGSAWVLIPAGLPGQYLQMSGGNVPSWGGVSLNLISLITTPVTMTTTSPGVTSIASGGNITNDGGNPVVLRGVCWKTTTGPTIADSKTTDLMGGAGTFTSYLTGILPGTTYYVRAFLINSTNVTYGNEVSFGSSAVIPTLDVTAPVTAITGSSAITGGNVLNDGGSPVFERGICYNLSSAPLPTLLNGTKVIATSPSGLGSFVCNITGLISTTFYNVVSYATNSAGTAYSPYIQFITPPGLTTNVATLISGGTAFTGGVLTVLGNAAYTVGSYGIAYSTITNALSPTFIQSGTNPNASVTFTTNLTGLTSGTKYYIRTYAQGAGYGTAYGPELSFTTTAATAPVIASTQAITGLSATTAISGGTITSDGGTPIIAKGVCWSTSGSPVLGTNNFTNDISISSGSSPFTSNITGLTSNTTYFVRAYATNSIGTSYGLVDVSFKTWVQAPYTIGQIVTNLSNVAYGYCAYVDALGHGFIVSNDIPFTGGWGCSGTSIVTNTLAGTGLANTSGILAACADRPIAASVASTYNGGGFTDWYLPSYGDWLIIRNIDNQMGMIGHSVNMYYTSTEISTVAAYVIMYTGGNGQVQVAQKVGGAANYINFIRAIRNF